MITYEDKGLCTCNIKLKTTVKGEREMKRDKERMEERRNSAVKLKKTQNLCLQAKASRPSCGQKRSR
jgi:hypothetical protein